MEKPKIDVFIVGAQKAGTTSLYDWLGSHPDIDAPMEAKDFHFFTIEEIYMLGYEAIERMYAKRRKLKVHCAVNYLYFSDLSSQRIQRYNSNAKIIACLRNPSDRVISAYKYFVKTLREPDTLSEVLDKERNAALSPSEMSDRAYLGHGLYDSQILDYMQRFSAENILITSFDDLIDSRKRDEVMKDICEFLGISSEFQFAYSHLNVSGKPRFTWLNYILRKSSITKRIGKFFPRKYRNILARRLERINTSHDPISVDESPTIRRQLVEYYRPVLDNLEKVSAFKVPLSWYE